MFERLSSGVGAVALTLLLAVLPTFGVDLPLWLRLALAVTGFAMIAWALRPENLFGKVIDMSPAETLMIVSAVGFFCGLAWYFTSDGRGEAESTAARPVAAHTPDRAPLSSPAPQGDADDLAEAQATVLGLWNTWLDRDDLTAEEINGLVLPPDDWMNERLQKMTRPYRVRANGAQFRIYWPQSGDTEKAISTTRPHDGTKTTIINNHIVRNVHFNISGSKPGSRKAELDKSELVAAEKLDDFAFVAVSSDPFEVSLSSNVSSIAEMPNATYAVNFASPLANNFVAVTSIGNTPNFRILDVSKDHATIQFENWPRNFQLQFGVQPEK